MNIVELGSQVSEVLPLINPLIDYNLSLCMCDGMIVYLGAEYTLDRYLNVKNLLIIICWP